MQSQLDKAECIKSEADPVPANTWIDCQTAKDKKLVTSNPHLKE